MEKKVLFICTGNVCRSPIAEGLFRHLVESEGAKGVDVASAGIGAMDGSPPSQNSIEVMIADNIDISGQRSQMLTREMVDEYSHIFGMGRSHVEVIRNYFPKSIEKTFVLREFIAMDSSDLDVPDPIGGDLAEYQETRNLIAETMPGILRFVLTGDLLP